MSCVDSLDLSDLQMQVSVIMMSPSHSLSSPLDGVKIKSFTVWHKHLFVSSQVIFFTYLH